VYIATASRNLVRLKGKKVTAQAPWVSLEMTFQAMLRTSAATGNSRGFSFELNASVGIPEGDRPNGFGHSMASHNIKKSSRRDAGHRCSAFSQLTKQGLFQKSRAAKMYRILLISGYICQAAKFRQKRMQKKKHVFLAK
jgi:hypothetical protein